MRRRYYEDFFKYLYENNDLYFDYKFSIYEILKQVYKKHTAYKSSFEGINFQDYKSEYNYICNIQKEAKSINEKINDIYKDELIEYYFECYKNGRIKSNDLIRNIYWEMKYSKFITIVTEMKLYYMKDMFEFNFKDLYKYRQLNHFIIQDIIEKFKKWCKDNLICENKLEDKDFEKEKLINDLMGEFFIR